MSKVTPKQTFYSQYFKRFLDIILSIPAVILTFPINILLAIITFFDVGRPIFFKQQRVGKDGKVFTLYKFRNMTNEMDEDGQLLPAQKRVTKFGVFVRTCSLDELLQFWNILIGQMSIIGPRPLPADYLPRYSERHMYRHAVRPGLECPVDGHLADIKEYYQRQFENDVWYVENVSFALDCKQMLRLVAMVFDRKERVKHASVTGLPFFGYDENGRANCAIKS